MNNLIDLHCHSIYSDGGLSPNDLMELASKSGVNILSITDHDIVDAYKNIDYSKTCGVKLITGVELSAKVDKGQMHILGYGIDVYNSLLNEKLLFLREENINKIKAILKVLYEDYDLKFCDEDIAGILSKIGNIGRPDIAKLCVKYGFASSVREAFNKYLVSAYDKVRGDIKNFIMKECIDLILQSGGIPVLAHPKSLLLNDKELLVVLREMISCGLLGIEVYHSSHNEVEMRKYLELANSLNLLVSGGSDYHGISVKPNVKIGSGIDNNLHIKKLSILDYL